jgi:acyl carrier protein
MGLDSVELVLAVEEEFGITISDAEASRCRTPGDLIAIVTDRMLPAGRPTCRSQAAFHRLRRSLGSVLGVPRNAVKLDAPIDRWLPAHARRQTWDRLRKEIGSRRWPELERPAWLQATLWSLALAAGGTGLTWQGPITGLGLAAVAGIVATRLTRPWADHLPAGHETVRSLVSYIPSPPNSNWTRADVASRIREIVIEQLSLNPTDYREDADFIRDLGMD